MIKQTEVDLKLTKEALKKEKDRLQEKEKAINDLITAQKKRADEESRIVEELKLTKELLTKSQQDLETKCTGCRAWESKSKWSVNTNSWWTQ